MWWDAPLVWYSVLISDVLSTVLVFPGIRLRPNTDSVTPPVMRRSEGGAGADEDVEDDVPVLGAGAWGGLCGVS